MRKRWIIIFHVIQKIFLKFFFSITNVHTVTVNGSQGLSSSHKSSLWPECCIMSLHTKALSEEQTDVFFHSKSSTVAYKFYWLNMLYIQMWQSMNNYTIVKRNLESWHQTWCYMSWNFILSENTKTCEYTNIIHQFHTQPCRWFCGTFLSCLDISVSLITIILMDGCKLLEHFGDTLVSLLIFWFLFFL